MHAEHVPSNRWRLDKPAYAQPTPPQSWVHWIIEHKTVATLPLVLLVGLLLWDGFVRWQNYPAFILPSPLLVGRKFLILAGDGTLVRHTQVTLVEIALGLLLGLTTACLLGYILGKYRAIEQVVAPYIVASQTVELSRRTETS